MNTTPPLASLKFVVLETTRRCNLRCIHCAVSEENNLGNYDARDLSMDVFHKLLPMLRKYKPNVQLSGHGETFLHPNFMEMLEEVVAAGCKTSFQTNGTILTPKTVEKVVSLGVETIMISIDGASSEVFNRIRRRASLEKIVNNIRLINETKKRFKTKSPHLGIEFTAMRQNIHELPAVVRMAGELGVENFLVAELAEYNMTRGQSLANDPLMAEWSPKAEAEARTYGINLTLPPHIPVPQLEPEITTRNGDSQASVPDSNGPSNPVTYTGSRKACKEPWERMFVQFNGDVRPCCVISESYGNLSTQSFQEVWQGPEYQLLRESLLSDQPFAVCVRCPLYGWEPQETAESVTATGSFREGLKRLMRRLSGPSSGVVRLPDQKLVWLVERWISPHPNAELHQILAGNRELTASCVAVLESGVSLSNSAFVEGAYRRILGRDPDEDGSQGYIRALDEGRISRGELIGLFLSSAEFKQHRNSLPSRETLPAPETSTMDVVPRL